RSLSRRGTPRRGPGNRAPRRSRPRARRPPHAGADPPRPAPRDRRRPKGRPTYANRGIDRHHSWLRHWGVTSRGTSFLHLSHRLVAAERARLYGPVEIGREVGQALAEL